MMMGKVIGRVSSTQKSDGLRGCTFVVVQPIGRDGNPQGNIVVAADGLGTGMGQVVLLCSGGAARRAVPHVDGPIDLAVAAVLDSVDING